MDLQAAHDFAVQLAKEAGGIARRHYNPDIVFDPKGDNTPVTEADKEINRLVIERCHAQYPEAGIVGEEESLHKKSEWLWVCDPIDGTLPYMLGAKMSTFCLALVRDGEPVVGIVYDFMNDRLYSAIKSGGAELNGKALHLAKNVPIKAIEFEDWPKTPRHWWNVHPAFFEEGWLVTNFLSVGFAMMAVAQGRLSGAVMTAPNLWDAAAQKIITEELGCIVTDLDGNDQRYDGEVNGLVVLHPARASEIREILAKARQ